MMPPTDIVDQSNNNKTLAPLDGLTGYAHKISEGHTYRDPFARPRLTAASDLRYVCGYHVLRAGTTSGTEQANYYLDACDQAGFDPTARGAFTMNDWEGWSDGFATAQQAHDFADRVNEFVGRESVIHYGGLPNQYISAFDHIWLADYRAKAPTLNPLFPQAAVWQWGNQAAGGGDTNQILDHSWLDHLADYDHLPPQEIDMTDDEHRMLADLHALLGAAAVNTDGSPVWQDPFGNPMSMPWNLGWIWEYVRHIRDDLTPDAIANAVVAKLPATGATIDQIEAAFKLIMDEVTLTINFTTP